MNLSVDHNLCEIFADTAKHKAIREIIRCRSINKLDVRDYALEGLDLDTVNTILDLGCGFGFFTHSLKDKVPLNATVLGIDRIPGNKSSFLDTCSSVGIKGEFIGLGVETVRSLPSENFDLILCSYALYFFSEIIPELARLLNPSGKLVIITHSDLHATECIDLVRETFINLGVSPPAFFPYEKLIAEFNNTNGHALLSRYFADVKQKEYKSSLLFNQGDFDDLLLYFKFKKPYYFPGRKEIVSLISNKILSKLKVQLDSGTPFRITKNDTIFVCSNPLVK